MTERLHFHFSPSCIEEGNGNPLQCSCLESLRDGGAWWAAWWGRTESDTTKATSAAAAAAAEGWQMGAADRDVLGKVGRLQSVSLSLCLECCLHQGLCLLHISDLAFLLWFQLLPGNPHMVFQPQQTPPTLEVCYHLLLLCASSPKTVLLPDEVNLCVSSLCFA